MKVAYLVHDTTDSTVRRRVRMLQEGGAQVEVLGFRRTDAYPATILGAPVTDLGRTHDARLGRRSLSVLRSLFGGGWPARLRDADVLLARNLEMLVLARLRRRSHPEQRIVYEALDIHRKLLGRGPGGMVLRWLERRLLRGTDLLLFSSPAFLHRYFEERQDYRGTSALLENKVSVLSPGTGHAVSAVRAPAPPWRLGWFGNIRCSKSLRILCRLADELGGLVQVVIRGRVSHVEFDDFDGTVAATPHVRYEGPYKEEDLSAIYADVHFVWAIDYFEEGLNSSWLLPCRLYEGTLHGTVPIAQRFVETGRWLAAHDAGVRLDDPATQSGAFFRSLDDATYRDLADRLIAIPRSRLHVDREGCRDLVETLRQA